MTAQRFNAKNPKIPGLLSKLATPAQFERATPRLGIWCSIRLSYGV